MQALTCCLSTKILTRDAYKIPSTFAVLGRSHIGFSRFPTFRRLQFHDLVLSRTITKSHVASDAAEVSTGLENAIAGIPKIKTSKTIHVKFQLQKECMFGDQFLLVGDDPMLGLWNPEDAIPMNWSDGHIWNVELDFPIGSTIQFKFLLKQCSGEILWQPGPDRIFKSWESNAKIIIAEDWENSEAQKILEEQDEAEINPQLETHAGGGGNVSKQSEQSCSVKSALTFSGNVTGAEEKLKQDLQRETKFTTTLTSNVLVPGIASQQAASTERALTSELGSIVDGSSFGVANGPH